MTKKHYIAIANALNAQVPIDDDSLIRFHAHICLALADVFAQDNPRFDRTIFLIACGLSMDAIAVDSAARY